MTDKARMGPSSVRYLAWLVLTTLAAMQPLAAAELRVAGTGAGLGVVTELADRYRRAHPELKVEIHPSLGSSGALKALKAGAIEVAISARPLKEDEKAAGLTQTPMSRTALALVTSYRTPPASLSSEQVMAIYGASPPPWSDGVPLRVVLRPESDTDTRLLRNAIPSIGGNLERLYASGSVPTAATDQDAANQIASIPGSFGLLSLSLVTELGGALRVVSFNGVKPSLETVASGSYPMIKSFYLVVSAKAGDVVQGFLRYARSREAQEVFRRHGHVQDGG